jgi:hypothetical protein
MGAAFVLRFPGAEIAGMCLALCCDEIGGRGHCIPPKEAATVREQPPPRCRADLGRRETWARGIMLVAFCKQPTLKGHPDTNQDDTY